MQPKKRKPSNHKANKPTSKASKQSKISRMLLERVPQTAIPQPYFSIPSPQPFAFPLNGTMIQGIKLLVCDFPQQVNNKIRSRIKGRIQRLSRYQDVYCVLGKDGKGMMIGDTFLDIRGVSAYCYGPKYLIIAFEDLRLDVFSIAGGLKLIKSLKGFTQKKVTFLKILSAQPNYENIILLTYTGKDVTVHRIEKSLFSVLSHKFHKKLIMNLEFPVTQIIQLPPYFKYYLRKDNSYRDCNLVAISAINCIWILKINHLRLNLDNFATIDLYKKVDQIGINSMSWGETYVNSESRDIKGDKLVLTCSFGSKVYFFILKEIQKYSEDINVATVCEWLESYPFELADDKKVAFCQFMKKNELLLITQDNYVIILGTRQNFPIYDRGIYQDEIECIKQKYDQHLQARTVALIQKKGTVPSSSSSMASTQPSHHKSIQAHIKDLKQQLSNGDSNNSFQPDKTMQQEFDLLNKQPLVTYADTFQYEYPSSQIYFLTEKEFGVYVYCDWRKIADAMKLQQKYQSAMVFYIAICKGANKFDLGTGDPYRRKGTWDEEEMKIQEKRQKLMSEEIQLLSIQFISSKLSRIKDVPAILDNITTDEQFFKLLIIPIEFLCQTQEFTFLFEVIKDKIISSLIPFTKSKKQNQKFYNRAEEIFFTALAKFIEHGKVRFIPESQLQNVMNYYLKNDQSEMVDRLAIYFDLEQIDQNIVVQCLLNNNLVVSLAHICTQGNESLFVTPFVKFWGVSQNYKRLKNNEDASAYALRALWYMRLCLQRNWILKEYTLQKYARMMGILSKQFLNEKILIGLLEILPSYCLQTLTHYFTIENADIINNEIGDMIKYPVLDIEPWIEPKPDNNDLQLLLSSIELFVKKSTRSNQTEYRKHMCMFLSKIVIFRTVRYNSEKYFEILMNLIEFNSFIKDINYGLEQKMIEEFRQQLQGLCSDFGETDFEEILSARYIVRILTLVYLEDSEFFNTRLYTLYEKSRDYQLIDLQAEIRYLQKNYAGCIEIYMHAKKSHKMLIYQFLESSFKRLTLQKRKQQKQVLSKCIKGQIKALVTLHPRKVKNLIQNYIPEIHEQLIEALKDDEQLQLDYLSDIMKDEYNSNIKQNLSEQSILRYVELMAIYHPDQLLEKFKLNPFFPIQESLKICEKLQVYDCIEYLYERMGCISQAVKIAALRIDSLFKTRNKYTDEDEMVAHYGKVKQILDNAIDICKKNHSEQIWQALLDSAIQLYRKYLNSDLPADQIDIFFYINGIIIQNLASNCTIQHTIKLLQTKYNNLGMGGNMTSAFINILSNLSYSINILYLSTNLVQSALRKQLFKDYLNKLRCYRTYYDCETCRFPIDRRQKSIHFQCGHAYHKQCVVCQQPMTCMTCLVSDTDQFSYYLNTLNPRFPKPKKIKELFQKFSDKRLEMSEMFKIEDFEKGESRRQIIIDRKGTANDQKKKRFEDFDEKVYQIQSGNRRVEDDLVFD